MQFSVLSSGSSGNALYIQSGETRILLDAGISGKQLETRLQSVAGVSLSQLNAILVTHEHVDHVRGLPQALKQSSALAYMTDGTRHAVADTITKVIPSADPDGRMKGVVAGEPFSIADVRVTPFAVSHDATEPVAYRFDAGDASLAVLTDLGYVSDAIKEIVHGCRCFVLETNHDVNMLRAGRYPWNVKKRILGDKGHLSNEDAAVALTDLLGTDEVEVYMAHLSEENNQPDLAKITVESTIREIHPRYVEQVRLHHTSRKQPTLLRQI